MGYWGRYIFLCGMKGVGSQFNHCLPFTLNGLFVYYARIWSLEVAEFNISYMETVASLFSGAIQNIVAEKLS